MKRFFTISGNDVKIFADRGEAEHESDRIIELELVSSQEGVGVAGVEGVSFFDWEDLRDFVLNYNQAGSHSRLTDARTEYQTH